MKKYLIYIDPKIGVAQAQLAFASLQKVTKEDLILQHGGAINHHLLDSLSGAVVLGCTDGVGIDENLISRLSPHYCELSQAVNQPEQVLSMLSDSTVDSTGVDDSPTDEIVIIGITSCPTGIAHTFMAAEGLEAGAESLGYRVKIETQGSVGAKNTLTAEDIDQADVVIIAADTGVNLDRFTGKRLYKTGTKAAINDGAKVIKTALSEAEIYGSQNSERNDLMTQTAAAKAEKKAALPGIYKHLMTGVSHMLPFVVAGGLLIALGFAIGSFQFGDQGIHIYKDEYRGTLGATLFWTGKAAFALFVPILGAYIAYSIGGRAALAAGMIGGYLAVEGGSGFLGAILAGFIAGYVVVWLTKAIKLPKTLEGLVPILILPLLSVMIIGLLMYYVIGVPVANANMALTHWLESLTGANALLLGLLVGAMMAFDMGGPVNKAAYVFGTSLLGSNIYEPMAAIMAAGMTPPLAIFFASMLFKNRFLDEEHEAAKAAGVLGISFITEGAIPFAARDPLRVIPALMVGSAVTGGLSMLFKCGLHAPHGGIFVLFIPNAVDHLIMYVVAIAAGTAVSALLLGLLKKPVQ